MIEMGLILAFLYVSPILLLLSWNLIQLYLNGLKWSIKVYSHICTFLFLLVQSHVGASQNYDLHNYIKSKPKCYSLFGDSNNYGTFYILFRIACELMSFNSSVVYNIFFKRILIYSS